MHRLTFANVCAALALFISLSGSAYAVTTLKRDSVGSREIRSRAVASAELRDAAVRAADVAPDAINGQHVGPDALGGPEIAENTLGVIPRAAHAEAAGVAENASEAAHAADAKHADEAGHALTAENAVTANTTDHANSADHADHADRARDALDAEHALSADSATRANTATSAEQADTATRATYADDATNAFQLGGRPAEEFVTTGTHRVLSQRHGTWEGPDFTLLEVGSVGLLTACDRDNAAPENRTESASVIAFVTEGDAYLGRSGTRITPTTTRAQRVLMGTSRPYLSSGVVKVAGLDGPSYIATDDALLTIHAASAAIGLGPGVCQFSAVVTVQEL